jgi:hypothetical protein
MCEEEGEIEFGSKNILLFGNEKLANKSFS